MEPPNIFTRVFNYFNGTSDFSSQKTDNNMNAKLIENSLSTEPRTIPKQDSFSAKTKMLHNSHKLSPREESWFNIEPQSFAPSSYPSSFYPGSSKSFQQQVFNINKGCFESLPVSIANQQDYNPVEQHQLPPPTFPQYCPAEVLQLASGSLPESMGYFCSELVDFVEFTLVESVCHRSRLEHNHQNRLAAEILAASKLNPNAKEFTPKTIIQENSVEDAEEKIDQLDGHIELTERDVQEDDEMCKSVIEDKMRDESQDDNKDNCNCDSSDDDDDYNDDDWDWDSDEEHSSVSCVDLSEFEDLFQVNLLVTNLTPCQSPSITQCPRLQEINRRFSKLYPDTTTSSSSSCVVKFSDNPVIILEPESLAQELQEARMSDFKQRQVDKERMERLLAPILTTTHRNRVYSQLYADHSS